jgi:hypothetical protein
LRWTLTDKCSIGDYFVFKQTFNRTFLLGREFEMKHSLPAKLVVVFAVLCLVSVCLCQTKQTSDWRKIDEKKFSFLLPKGFTKTDMTGVENYLGEYYKGKTRFLFVEGDTASNAYNVRREPEMKDYRETETVIKGRKTNIRTYALITNGKRRYRAELNVGNWEKAQIELYMELEGENSDDLKIAKQIFNSVVFSKQKQKSKKSETFRFNLETSKIICFQLSVINRLLGKQA